MANTIYLVNPPDKDMLSGFPAALTFLSSWVRRTVPETEVSYLDLAVNKTGLSTVRGRELDISKELDSYNLFPGSTYALTATTATYQNALRVARAIKKKDTSATVLLGGHHAMHQADVVLQNHPEIDFCGIGEGEKTLEDIARGVTPDLVRGLAYRSASGEIKKNHAGMLSQKELDTFHFEGFDWQPVYDSLKNAEIRGQFGYFDISTARGCNLKCTFCTFGEDVMRDMSTEAKGRILKDLSESALYARAKGVNIHDNDFAQNSRKTHALCNLILDQELDLKWTIQTRVEHLNNRHESLVKKLANAGCVEVYLGVENFDPEITQYLKHVRNPDRYLQNTREAVANTLKYRITCNVNLQLGVPGETQDSIQNNLDALHMLASTAKEVGGEVVIYPQLSVVYPGTAMARMPVRGTDLHLPADSFERFTAWEWEQEQGGLVEYLGKNFAHGNGGIPLGIINVDRFVNESIIDIDHEKLTQVNMYLDKMKQISEQYSQLRVFDYSDYIHR